MSKAREAVIGHFSTARQAREAYVALRRAQLFRPEMEIQVRTPNKHHQDLPLSATDVRGATFRGAALGAVAGLIGAAFFGAVGGTVIGFSPLLAGLGIMGGLVLGMFAGALLGPMEPHPALAEIESTGASLIVDSPHESDLKWAAAFFRNRDALIDSRPKSVPPPPAVPRRPSPSLG
jgi:hypothetical protein